MFINHVKLGNRFAYVFHLLARIQTRSPNFDFPLIFPTTRHHTLTSHLEDGLGKSLDIARRDTCDRDTSVLGSID